VSKHHQTCQLQYWQLGKATEEIKQDCQGFMMDEVVGNCTYLRVDQIPNHANVWDEEEQREPPPGIIQSQEKIEGQKDERKFFQLYQCFCIHIQALRGKKV
jgi:hypothetical protein